MNCTAVVLYRQEKEGQQTKKRVKKTAALTGITGFEPVTSWLTAMRSDRTELYPNLLCINESGVLIPLYPCGGLHLLSLYPTTSFTLYLGLMTLQFLLKNICGAYGTYYGGGGGWCHRGGIQRTDSSRSVEASRKYIATLPGRKVDRLLSQIAYTNLPANKSMRKIDIYRRDIPLSVRFITLNPSFQRLFSHRLTFFILSDQFRFSLPLCQVKTYPDLS